MDEDKERLDKLLDEFPFHRQASQRNKLANYMITAPGNNKVGVQDKTGISQPTIRKIQAAFDRLELEDKIFLIEELIALKK